MLIHGDCIEKMKELQDASIDAIVTDPPYELGFMGKEWDVSGVAYNVNVWREALRVLKPGGHLIAFGGTRTYHRMAVAIEDAGFEIRDMIEWVYSSGFPKSLNVGKAVDKRKDWAKYQEFAKELKTRREELRLTKKQAFDRCGFTAETFGGNSWFEDGRIPSKKDYELLKNGLSLGERFDLLFEEVEREFVSKDKNWGKRGDIPLSGYKEFDVTKGFSPWEGYGSALKPAHEPTCLARKPLSENTIVENCLKYGTGALDIDGTRIPAGKEHQQNATRHTNKIYRGGFNDSPINSDASPLGRFPANILCTDDALNDGVMTKSGKDRNPTTKGNNTAFFGSGSKYYNAESNHGGSGSKSRYFDIDVWGEKHGLLQFPKASKKDRGEGNTHCTCKPTHLMAWLVRLVSKPGDTVLDPFMGSGTTGIACKKLGRKFIGIELNEEYIKIARERTKTIQTPFNL